MRVDVRVYRRYRKHPCFPDYEQHVRAFHQTYVSVPVFVVSEQRLEDIAAMEPDEQLREHCREPLLLFTDRRRVLAVSPEGYDYARYVGVIDQRTASDILNRL